MPKAAEALRNLCTNHAENKNATRYAGAIPLLVFIFKPTLINTPEPTEEVRHLLEMTAGALHSLAVSNDTNPKQLTDRSPLIATGRH